MDQRTTWGVEEMKLWTLTTDDCDGVNTRIFVTKEGAEAAFGETVERFWREFVGENEPCPEDRADALSQLGDMTGFMDGARLDEHEVTIFCASDAKDAIRPILERTPLAPEAFAELDAIHGYDRGIEYSEDKRAVIDRNKKMAQAFAQAASALSLSEDRLELNNYEGEEQPAIDKVKDARAALGQLLEQVYQMQGMFPDEDGAIARAVADAEEALA